VSIYGIVKPLSYRSFNLLAVSVYEFNKSDIYCFKSVTKDARLFCFPLPLKSNASDNVLALFLISSIDVLSSSNDYFISPVKDLKSTSLKDVLSSPIS